MFPEDVLKSVSPPNLEPPGRPAGTGPLSSHRTNQTGGSIPPGHSQQHRPEDPGTSLGQKKAGADGYPQE